MRQKLGGCDDCIETVGGVGYRFTGCQVEAVRDRVEGADGT